VTIEVPIGTAAIRWFCTTPPHIPDGAVISTPAPGEESTVDVITADGARTLINYRHTPSNLRDWLSERIDTTTRSKSRSLETSAWWT
jgi:hypothetical protein